MNIKINASIGNNNNNEGSMQLEINENEQIFSP